MVEVCTMQLTSSIDARPSGAGEPIQFFHLQFATLGNSSNKVYLKSLFVNFFTCQI